MRVGLRPENPVEVLGMLAGRLGLEAGKVPAPLFEAYFAPIMARTIMAGVRLGIFDALAERPGTSAEIAVRLDLDQQGTDVLMLALHSMRYLDRDGSGTYRNAEQASRHLVRGCERPLVETVGRFTYDMWELAGALEDAVRTGEPLGWLHTKPAGDPWWESYMRGLFEISQLRAGAITAMIGAHEPRTLLDVAGGHSGFSIAMCRRHPGLRATVVELEGAARIGEQIVAEEGFADRVGYRVGDMFETDLGSGYDVAMANSILHHFDADANVTLLRRINRALAPGGMVAIVEQERPPEGKRGTQIGTLTGVMFYVSSKVRTYTAGELMGFAEQAGFELTRARRSALLPGIVVVTGRREP